jgi:D-tagatose-1,6-bisphosphate aldolase subunit GatZ/KbaZ
MAGLSWGELAGIGDPGEQLAAIARTNRSGDAIGIYSICSADPDVLRAGMTQALRDGVPVLIEATTNQVNQFGGYTGMTPAAFRSFAESIADAVGLPRSRVLLGGDHLGPYAWRAEPSDVALERARVLVDAYVRAGFTKIHLDASMRLGGDPVDRPLDEEVVASRAAELCGVAEAAARTLPLGSPRPVYVVGSEVPIPGGELADSPAPSVTEPGAVERTLDLVRRAFERRGVGVAIERIVAVVVQPGVEFGDMTVFAYDRSAAAALAARQPDGPPLVYEAHSTDYQTADALAQMVGDHFAILKVGPALTFALREALFALEAIESEWLAGRPGFEPARLRATLAAAMAARPEHWRPYVGADRAGAGFAREFSFSDRVRYYWAVPEVRAARDRLLANLSGEPIPLALLSQYLPYEFRAVRDGTLAGEPRALIRAAIGRVIDDYASACGMVGG